MSLFLQKITFIGSSFDLKMSLNPPIRSYQQSQFRLSFAHWLRGDSEKDWSPWRQQATSPGIMHLLSAREQETASLHLRDSQCGNMVDVKLSSLLPVLGWLIKYKGRNKILMRNTILLWCLALTGSLLLGAFAHMCWGEVPIGAFANGAPSMVLKRRANIHFRTWQMSSLCSENSQPH